MLQVCADAERPRRRVTAVGHLIVQAAEQAAADTDLIAQLVGETAAGMVAVGGWREEGAEKQQEAVRVLMVGVERLASDVSRITADLRHRA